MKKTERILIIAGIILLILNIFFIFPGGNTLFVLSLGLLSLLYFFLGFALFNKIRFRDVFKKYSYQNISALRVLGTVGAGISLSITLNGILFKVMFWPGSFSYMIIGIISILILAIILKIKNSQNKMEFYTNISSRCILFGLIAIILSFVPNQKLAAIKFRNEPEYAKALIDVMNNPDNEQFQIRYREESRKRIEN